MTRSPRRWTVSRSALASLLVLSLLAHLAPPAQAQNFVKSRLDGPNLDEPTSLQFGPDGRLYVTERFGRIHALTIERDGANDYDVIAHEVIDLVHDVPNRDDGGLPNESVVGRQVTGILVVGSASSPELYVAHSDPRTAVGHDTHLDTNSGVLSRLTWNGVSWEMFDLVRGLPRCEENHGPNGAALFGSTLYLAQGGNTNMGAPSHNFAELPEYALSAAILAIDLDQIGGVTYDLPTLDDPGRPNDGPGGGDRYDPFGGNDGHNQARLVQGGPVQIYASGLRNPYDVLIHSSGRMYTIDNGPNQGWGAEPIDCSNQVSDGADHTYGDGFLHIGHVGDGGGFYGGHPNPYRASRSNTIHGESPVDPGLENPVECQYIAPGMNGAMHTWPVSTNGLTEYRATNFEGAMTGDILTVGFTSGRLDRLHMDGDGHLLSVTSISHYVGTFPLDVVCHADDDEFPGTIWVNCMGENAVFVFEPTDETTGCTGTYSFDLDEDGDGYSNADELDNGTDPCASGDQPLDQDNDGVSDIHDPDDDNDELVDTIDPFAIDPQNGTGTNMPLDYGWSPGDPGIGLFGLGFTGLMADGITDYIYRYNAGQITPGGAAGRLTFDRADGTARGSDNDLFQAFQFGVAVNASTGVFTAHTRIDGPFFDGHAPAPGSSHGFFVGTGDQDHYVELVIAAGGIELYAEEAGFMSSFSSSPFDSQSANEIDLYLVIDPAAGTVHAGFAADDGPYVPLPEAAVLTGPLLSTLQGPAAIAVGVLASGGHQGETFSATWDGMSVQPGVPGGAGPIASGDAIVLPSGTLAEVDVLANDVSDGGFDLSNLDIVDPPAHGTAWVENGLVRYQHAGGGPGADAFAYRVADLEGHLSNVAQVEVTVVPADAGQNVLYRVNVGGPRVEAPFGPAWEADSLQSPGPWVLPGTTSTYRTDTGVELTQIVPPGTPAAVFQSERWLLPEAESMSWNFAIHHPTAVEVRLYFCELFLAEPYVRRFDPEIEGVFLRQVDPFLESRGSFRGYMRTARLRVVDGNLDIDLHRVLQNPALQAIEILDLLP